MATEEYWKREVRRVRLEEAVMYLAVIVAFGLIALAVTLFS